MEQIQPVRTFRVSFYVRISNEHDFLLDFVKSFKE